jgi:hypothetical protein
MKRVMFITVLSVVGLVLTSTGPALGAREVVQAGNLYLSDNGGLVPSKLPKHGSAPVRARIEAGIGTVDGSHPPALQTIDLDVDRTIGIDATGLPVCTLDEIRASSTVAARRACPGTVVGSGEAEVEVAFPEQAPFTAKGPIVLFNGGVRGGTTTVLVHTYVDVPAPTAIVVAAQVSRIHRARYGLNIKARIPRIAGGAGSVTSFRLTVGRSFTYRGRRHSFLSAGCPTGSYATQGQATFSDGTKLGVTHVFPCTPQG